MEPPVDSVSWFFLLVLIFQWWCLFWKFEENFNWLHSDYFEFTFTAIVVVYYLKICYICNSSWLFVIMCSPLFCFHLAKFWRQVSLRLPLRLVGFSFTILLYFFILHFNITEKFRNEMIVSNPKKWNSFQIKTNIFKSFLIP